MNAARRIEDFNRQSANVERDAMNREMKGKKPSAEEIKRAKALEAQIEQDLNSLQTEYNNVVIKLQSREAIENKYVSETSERIHRHADRLRTSVAFPKPAADEQEIVDEAAFSNSRKALIELCNRILVFLDSSIFQNPNVLDIKSAIDARQKLEAVVRLASGLKKTSG